MSGSTAKTARRIARLTETIVQAHDRRDKDDVEACHAVLHQALGLNDGIVDGPDVVAPLGPRVPFDEAFRRLCIEHGARASYVLADRETPQGTRLISGGDAELCAHVDRAMRG